MKKSKPSGSIVPPYCSCWYASIATAGAATHTNSSGCWRQSPGLYVMAFFMVVTTRMTHIMKAKPYHRNMASV